MHATANEPCNSNSCGSSDTAVATAVAAAAATATASGGSAPWVRDVVVVTTTALTTTGGTVWGAAQRAIDYLEAIRDKLGLERPGIKILELGAGCGLLGLTLARNLPAVGEVCLTEQAAGGALDHLRANVDANVVAGTPGMSRVTTTECDWTLVLGGSSGASGGGGDAEMDACSAAARPPQEAPVAACALLGSAADPPTTEDRHSAAAPAAAAVAAAAAERFGAQRASYDKAVRLLSTRWDVIVGSDLVYDEAGTTALPRVMRALALAGRAPPADPKPACSGSGRAAAASVAVNASVAGGGGGGGAGRGAVDAAPVIYAHTKHRYDTADLAFLSSCAAAGLEVDETLEPGAPQPPPSPPPLSELFPEMRVVVWRITVVH